MRIYLSDSYSVFNAIARALAAGHAVFCEETCEGWQLGDDLTPRHALKIARKIMDYNKGGTFFYYKDDNWNKEA